MEYSGGDKGKQSVVRLDTVPSSSPSLLVACKYSDLARWYILQLTCAVPVSSRCCPVFCQTAKQSQSQEEDCADECLFTKG